MRRWLLCCLLSILMALALAGCSSKQEDTEAKPPSAPINNNAPEARNAPPAPINPSIPLPGGKHKKP